jgi:predicted Rossmann fold flavoprotein
MTSAKAEFPKILKKTRVANNNRMISPVKCCSKNYIGKVILQHSPPVDENLNIMQPWNIVIIGGGPAGLMAGARAAARGRRVLILEKNNTPGAKILISGGGRCNVTHDCDARGIIEAVGSQGKFLHSALAAFGPRELVEFLRAEGVPTYVEPDTGKVFPQSNRSSDILAVLLRRLKAAGGEVSVSEPVVEVENDAELECGFRLTTARRTISAEKLLIATGGKSYPDCGTTGDGYRFAEKLGHTIVAPRPALTPICTPDEAIRALQGITLPDVLARVVEQPSDRRGDILAASRGALLFAHFGVTGPAAMDISRTVSGHPTPRELTLDCDLLPDWRENRLEETIAEECLSGGKRTVSSLLDAWVPHRVGEIVLGRADIDPERRLAELSKAERRRIVQGIKHFLISVEGTLGFRKAEVTSGGVSLEEVDSRSMESKKRPHLYFAGELLDLDGPIGGYNLQIALSTGFLAGEKM